MGLLDAVKAHLEAADVALAGAETARARAESAHGAARGKNDPFSTRAREVERRFNLSLSLSVRVPTRTFRHCETLKC
jgi:hypothetical protein